MRLSAAKYPVRLPTLPGVQNNGEEGGGLGLLALSARLAHALRVHILPMNESMGEEDDALDPGSSGLGDRRCARRACSTWAWRQFP